jgi:hypothetical protein
MAGNVREWTSEENQPGMRGLRGGGFGDPVALNGIVTFPVDAAIDFNDEATGFRCAADITYDECPISEVFSTVKVADGQ